MRRLALLAALALAIGLSACGPSAETADSEAQAFCKAHGGVDHIEYYDEDWPFKSTFDAECRDGSEID